MKLYWKLTTGVASLTLFAAVALAQFAKPEDAIEYRKGMMILIGNHFGQLGAVVKGEKPFDKEAVQKNAKMVEMASQFSWEAFTTAGSDKGDTKMKASAIETPDQFKAAVAAYRLEAEKLGQAAGSGDEAAFKTQFGATAQTCKACHGSFRK